MPSCVDEEVEVIVVPIGDVEQLPAERVAEMRVHVREVIAGEARAQTTARKIQEPRCHERAGSHDNLRRTPY